MFNLYICTYPNTQVYNTLYYSSATLYTDIPLWCMDSRTYGPCVDSGCGVGENETSQRKTADIRLSLTYEKPVVHGAGHV